VSLKRFDYARKSFLEENNHDASQGAKKTGGTGCVNVGGRVDELDEGDAYVYGQTRQTFSCLPWATKGGCAPLLH